jgi:hypothetical protein
MRSVSVFAAAAMMTAGAALGMFGGFGLAAGATSWLIALPTGVVTAMLASALLAWVSRRWFGVPKKPVIAATWMWAATGVAVVGSLLSGSGLSGDAVSSGCIIAGLVGGFLGAFIFGFVEPHVG